MIPFGEERPMRFVQTPAPLADAPATSGSLELRALPVTRQARSIWSGRLGAPDGLKHSRKILREPHGLVKGARVAR